MVTLADFEERPFPRRWARLCEEWHDGMDSTSYAVSSTGGLYRGSIRPRGSPEWVDGVLVWPIEGISDGEWLLGLWESLESEASRNALWCEQTDNRDRSPYEGAPTFAEEAEDFREFLAWIAVQINELRNITGIE